MRPQLPGKLHVALDRNVLTLTIDRPPLNVLDLPLLDEIQRALATAADDASLCAVVLRGAGAKAFSAGVDIGDHRPVHARAMLRAVHGIVERLLHLPHVTIAGIHGFCLGGGLELATSCDLVVADPDTTLGQPEIKVGCFPPVACIRLAAIIGPARAADMILTGEPITAQCAYEMGLLSRLGPLERTLEELFDQLRSQSRHVLRTTVLAMRRRSAPEIARALHEAEAIYSRELIGSADITEGIEAFLEKRSPRWRHA